VPYKDPEKRRAQQKIYSDRYYKRHQAKVIKKVAGAKKDRRAWWREYKATLGCFGCEENDPNCLEFHHVISDGKKDNEDSAGRWANINMRGRERLLKELWATCVPLCSNCHRKVHAMAREIDRENEDCGPDPKRERPRRDRGA
jgi:hypothetical protein